MKKKNKTANLIMVAMIVLIAAGGVFLAGRILGWFGGPGNAAVLTDIRGIVTLERNGIAFNVQDDTELRKGDVISCADKASAEVRTKDGSVVLGQGSRLSIDDPREGALSASLSLGEAFTSAKDAQVDISIGEEKITLKNASAAFSARSGACSVSLLSGEAAGVKAGEVKEWVGGQASVRALDINSLSEFVTARIRAAGDVSGLVISKADVDALEARRAAEQAAAAERAEAERRAAEEAAARAAEEAERRAAEEAAARAEAERIAAEEAAAKAAEEAARAEAERLAAEEAAAKAEAERKAAEEAAAAEAAKPHCTITINCSTILDNWDSLDKAKAGYVPSNGVILASTSVTFTEGESVFDVLARVCEERGIQIESSWEPVFDSHYVEGIGHIYEFDCGLESGWVYKVNGWFPNYGCSSYTVANGDDIAWLYSCNGLGTDVGAPAYN